MDEPKELRAKAAKSRRLAETMVSDPLTVERLNELADRLDKRAAAEEAKGR